MSDEKQWALALGAIAEIYGRELNSTALRVYYEIFKEEGFTVNQINQASKHLLKTREFTSMPTPAEFINAIKGSNEDQAELQSHIVLQAVRGDSQIFTDPVTQHLMTTRWMVDRLKETLVEREEHFFVRDFKEAYIAYSNTKDSLKQIGSIPPKIQGMIEKIGV